MTEQTEKTPGRQPDPGLSDLDADEDGDRVTGGGKDEVSHSDIVITKQYDKSSP